MILDDLDDLGTVPGMIIADLPKEELDTINEGIELFGEWTNTELLNSHMTQRLFAAAEKVKDLVLAGFVHPDFFQDPLFLAAVRMGDLKEQISALRRQALAAKKAFHEKHPDIEAPYVDFRMSSEELDKLGNADK